MLTLHANSETETAQIAADIGLALKPGDLLLLEGDLGAGKTVFCRSLIRTLAENPVLEVPSPTYTLCQTYDGRLPVAHYDLYRLAGMDELDELGWEDFLETGVSLMEWPGNCFDETPVNSVTITITAGTGDERTLLIDGEPSLKERIERSFEVRRFLRNSGRPDAVRKFLLGDASVRSYETIDNETVLMNAPEMPDGPIVKNGKPYSKIAHLAENVTAFVAIDEVLRSKGFRAPEIYSRDLDAGLLLIEHLGNNGLIDLDGKPIAERYFAAAQLLAEMHEQSFGNQVILSEAVCHDIPAYDRGAMMAEVELMLKWYVPHYSKSEPDPGTFIGIWNALIDKLQDHPTSLVLRDYHSPNLIWDDREKGSRRVGLIDFQDAVIGPQSYDLASLAQDARVSISEALEAEILQHYVSARHRLAPAFDETQFRTGYAIMAAQRATKVIGIFVRLDVRDNKPNYLQHLPRAKDYLARSLRHPVLRQYRKWVSTVVGV